jgi:hypothetical protein
MAAVDEISVKAAEVTLEDSMTATDHVGVDAAIAALQESMTGVDDVVAEAEKVLTDSMTGGDSLYGEILVSDVDLADVMVGSDEVSVKSAAAVLGDSMSALEQLVAAASMSLSDAMSGGDVLSGILTPGSPILPDAPGTFGFNDVHMEANAGGSGADLMYTAVSRAAGSGIMVYDVTVKSNPTRYAWVSLPETPVRLAMNWPILYATSSTGLYSILCTPLAAPSQSDYIALCPSISPAPRVAIWGNRAYVNCSNNGLQIVNIFDPSAMVEVTGHDFDVGDMGTYTYPTWPDAVNTWNPPNPAHSFFYGIYAAPPTGVSWGYQACFQYSGGIGISVDATNIYLDNGRVVWKLTRSDTPSLVWVYTCMVTQLGAGLSNSFDTDSGQVYGHQRGTGGTSHLPASFKRSSELHRQLPHDKGSAEQHCIREDFL